MKNILSTKDAAEMVGISESTLRKQRMDGARLGHMPQIPYYKLGKTVRYRLADIEAWLDRQVISGKSNHQGQK